MEMITKKEVSMTSLQIAELTGKEHKNIIRDIRVEIESLGEEIGGLIFELGSYTDKQNQERTMFNLTEDGVMQLALKYDAVSRYKCIQELKRLKELGNQFKVPTTFIEAMQLATETLIVNERLTVENKKLESKVSILVHTNKLFTASEIASELGFKSAIELNKRLAEDKFQHYVNGTWVVNAKMGYVSIKQNVLESGKIVYDRKFTGMGREYLIEKFLNKKKEITNF